LGIRNPNYKFGFLKDCSYIDGMEIKVMINKKLVLKAVGLFYMTTEMDHMNSQDERFAGLYEMECQLFDLMAKMSLEEKQVYQELINHGLK
jgi:hypothetical protein